MAEVDVFAEEEEIDWREERARLVVGMVLQRLGRFNHWIGLCVQDLESDQDFILIVDGEIELAEGTRVNREDEPPLRILRVPMAFYDLDSAETLAIQIHLSGLVMAARSLCRQGENCRFQAMAGAEFRDMVEKRGLDWHNLVSLE